MTLERAATLLDLGRPSEALDALAEAGDEGLTGRGHCLRALAHLKLGDPRAAERSAAEARAADPGEEWGYRLGAIAALRQAKARPARELATEAVRVAPHEPFTHQVLAEVLLFQGDLGPARMHAEEVVRLAPYRAVGHEILGKVLLRQGFPLEAETALRAALAIEPQDADCMALLATALDLQKRSDEAGELRLSALRADPQNEARQRDVLRKGGTAAAGGVFALGKLGLLSKIFLLNGALHSGELFSGSTAGVVLPLVLVVFAGMFGWHLITRRRHGRTVPPLVWEGLRPQRRNADLLWLASLCGLFVIGGLIASVAGPDPTVPLAAAALGTAGLALTWRARAGAARSMSFRDLLALIAPIGRSIFSRSPRRATPLVGAVGGEVLPGPSLDARWRRGALQLLVAFAVGTVVAAESSVSIGLLVVVLTAAALAPFVDSRTLYVVGMPFRICLDGTSQPASWWLLALRGALRLVLAPVTAVMLLWRSGQPRRLPHDRLTGTTVTGLQPLPFGATTS